MKRVISLCLVSLVAFGAVIPTLAQSRRSAVPRTKKADAKTGFASARAYTDGLGVLVEWEMAVEIDNAGFYVYRSDSTGQHMVSPEMILSSSLTIGAARTAGEKYSFFDAEGSALSIYHVRALQTDGRSVNSATTAPTLVSDLRSLGYPSSAELSRQMIDAKSNGSVLSNPLVLPRTLAKEVSVGQFVDDPVNHQWVISQPGVRIGVRKEGIYRVSKTDLQAAGFDVNIDPSLWQLYVGGEEQAMMLGANADYIEFYGKGTDTPETDTRTYYLVAGATAGKRMASQSARAAAGTVTSPSYSQTFVQKERTSYLNKVLNGDAENYFGRPVSFNSTAVVNFSLLGVDFASPTSTMELRFQGYSFDSHVVQVTLNGEPLESATGISRNQYSKQYVIPTSFLREGANSVTLRAIGVSTDFSFFDTISVGFARQYKTNQNQLQFYTHNSRIARLQGFTSPNVRVFDMTTAASPILITNLNVVPDGAGYGLAIPAGRGKLMYAVEDSAILPAISITANDPALLGVPDHAGKLVIISHKNFLAQAESWAEYRRGQGFSVKVVEVSEIYDEFNFGTMSSNSIKTFLQYAKSNWQTPPDYVLLIGDASYDSRNYENTGYNNLVPTKIVNTIFTEAGSDDSLADFNNDGLSEIAVGRIPARDGQAVTNALAKVAAYEQAAAHLTVRGALFAYDCFDSGNNYDFQQISVRLGNQLPALTPKTMIGRCDTPAAPETPQTLLVNAINTGKFVVNYSGHGAVGTWAHSSFFSSNTVPLLTNANNQSIFTMLTCLNGFFLHPTFVSLAENLVASPNGGAVASWASTGETTPDVQELMAARFFSRLGSGPLERLGDLINDSKSAIPGGTDVRLSWALIGDPMLKVRTASTGDRPVK